MADESFRILLDATHLHLECFKYVWVNVSPREFKTISDFKKNVLRKISVERDFNLYLKGGLLLDEETVTVLREDDVVQIKYKTPNPVKESSMQCVIVSRKRNLDESCDSIDVNSKKQKLEISSLSSDTNENNFINKKSKKKKKKEPELSVNSENCFDSEEKRKKHKGSPVTSGDFCSILIEQERSPKGKSKVRSEDVNSKIYESKIIVPSSNGNMNQFVGKKSEKGNKKKEIDLPVYSKSFCSNLLEKRKTQRELFVNSENVCCVSVEQRKEQTESSITFENGYSALIEKNQSSKNSLKKKGKMKSPIAYGLAVTELDSECSPQKKKNINKASKTMIFDPEKVFTMASIDGLSSKTEFNVRRSESSSTVVTGVNSEEVNNSQSKIKRSRRHRKCEENTNTVDSCMIISNNVSSSKSELNLHQNESSPFVTDINSEDVNNNQPKKKRKRRRKRKKGANAIGICDDIDGCDFTSNVKSSSENIDESINRKHILYLNPAKNQESNYFNYADEFPNSSTEKIILQPLDYPKMSTPAQSNICSIPDLQVSVMSSKKSKVSCDKNYSVLPNKSTTECIALQNDRENKEKQLFENLPDLTTLPVVGTHIAYKTLELDESYSPIASDYREGIIEKIDPDTEELEIRLVNEIILPGRIGKFENLSKDEVPEPSVKTYDVLKWCDLIEPKLLYSLPE